MEGPAASSRPALGKIVTFYSYKGGVGRSMALGNIAVLLARMGKTVLMVDWDLEAPGLDRYFTARLGKPIGDSGGLLSLLEKAGPEYPATSYYGHLVPVTEFDSPKFHLLPCGDRDERYAGRVAAFSWVDFFSKKQGGQWLESLREQWQRDYDFILLDSRTGVTDSGGVCTIQMPDLLVLVLGANHQNLDGCLRTIDGIHQARTQLPYDRPRLPILPILSRFDGRQELDLSREWLQRIAEALAPTFAPWLPAPATPLDFMQRTKLPHIPRYSFGEELAVLRESPGDPEQLPYCYTAITGLIAEGLETAGMLLAGTGTTTTVPFESERDREKKRNLAEMEYRDVQLRKAQWYSRISLSLLALLVIFWGVGYATILRPKLETAAEAEKSRRKIAPIEALADVYNNQLNTSQDITDPDRYQHALESAAAKENRSADELRREARAFASSAAAKSHPTVTERALSNFVTNAQDTEFHALLDAARFAAKTNNFMEAEKHYRSLVDRLKGSESTEDWRVAAKGLAASRALRGKMDEAIALLRSVLDSARRQYGSGSIQSAEEMVSLARNLVMNHNDEEAEGLYRDAIGILQQGNPKKAEEVNLLNNSIGDYKDLLVGQGNSQVEIDRKIRSAKDGLDLKVVEKR